MTLSFDHTDLDVDLGDLADLLALEHAGRLDYDETFEVVDVTTERGYWNGDCITREVVITCGEVLAAMRRA